MSLSARTVRAGRTRRPRARLRVQIRRNNAADESNRNRFARVAMFSRKERRVLAIQILPSHHRVFDAGAVLGVVNALRFASTRPVAGPSGIDDASARHVSGSYAMVVSMMTDSNEVDARIAQAYVGVITSVPHGTPSVRRNGQRSAHPVGAHRARHRAQSSPHRSPLHDDRRRLVGTPHELRAS